MKKCKPKVFVEFVKLRQKMTWAFASPQTFSLKQHYFLHQAQNETTGKEEYCKNVDP